MIVSIVKKLKTGSVKNVIPYGTATPGSLPYTVVKPEYRPGNVRAVRIIPHFKPGDITGLENYVFDELMQLLDGFQFTTMKGEVNSLYTEGEYSGIIPGNDDGSIAMERVFLAPFRTE